MTTNITETLPWIDYEDLFAKIEERGMEQGLRNGKKEIAKNMLRRNKPIDEIIEDTGLTRAEVERLKGTD